MANTECLNTLELVRQAKKAVASAELNKDLTPDQRNTLVGLYWDLEDLEDKLILQDISKQVDVLTSDASDLANLTANMDKSVAQLSVVADTVNVAAKAVGALVQIASTASAAGLI